MKELFIIDEKKKLHQNAKRIEYYINENGCYNCISHRISDRGYPMKKFNGVYTLMSRYIWYLSSGQILTSDIHVLHKCDNPLCINIDHLFTGSNNDNVQDKVNKNRQVKHSMMSDADVEYIKRNYESTSKELSKIFTVSDTTIRNIWNEKTHKYIIIENYEEIKLNRKERVRLGKIKNLPYFRYKII